MPVAPIENPGDTFTNVVYIPVSFTYEKDSMLGLDAQENPNNEWNEKETARRLFSRVLDAINDGAEHMVIGLPPIRKEE